jgi:hypothetical protein
MLGNIYALIAVNGFKLPEGPDAFAFALDLMPDLHSLTPNCEITGL